MRYLKIACVFLSVINFAHAQNNYWQLPHDYNSFVKNPNITWAIEISIPHTFAKTDSIDIHSYLLNAQKTGKVRSYITTDYSESFIKQWKRRTVGDFYIEIDKDFNLEIPDSLKDSSNSMLFHEIYYVENHKLKTHIISGGPEYPVITSNGVFLGNAVIAYSSLHFYNSKLKNRADKMHFLGQT